MPLFTPAIFSPHPYHAAVRATADQTHTSSGSFVVVAYNNEESDPNNNFTANAYTAPLAGYYAITARGVAVAAADAAGVVYAMSIFVNGVETLRGTTFQVEALLSGNVHLGVDSADLHLAAGDVVDIRVVQTSGGSRVLTGASNLSYFHIALRGL